MSTITSTYFRVSSIYGNVCLYMCIILSVYRIYVYNVKYI